MRNRRLARITGIATLVASTLMPSGWTQDLHVETVDAALRDLTRAGRGVERSAVPPEVRRALDRTKQALRNLMLESINKTPEEPPQRIAQRLESLARTRGWTDSKGVRECRGSYGCLDSLALEQPPGYPHLLLATTTLSIPFGTDTSLYLLEKKAGRWSLVLEQVASGYHTIGGAQMGLEWRVSSAAGEEPFLITASTSAAEAGVFQPLRLRVQRIGANATHPRILLDSFDVFDISEPWVLSADHDSFVLRYHGSYALDVVRWGRYKVNRFVVRGNTVTRLDPIAETADEFLDEWVSLPWKEAQRWSSPHRYDVLKKWHDRLHARKNYHSEVHIITPCQSDGAARTEVTIWIDANGDPLPDQLIALVERTGDRFLMRDFGRDGEWDETLPDRVKCPRKDLVLTHATADVDGDGKADSVEIVLKDGYYIAGPREDFDCPTGYYGVLISRVTLQGRIVESILGSPAVCGGPWTLFLADYNHDGQLDFNIGLQENVVNSFYMLFTIGRDGRVNEMKVRHDDGSVDNSITAKTTGNSIEFEVTRKGIRAKSLDHPADPTVAFWTTLYEWQAERKMFEEGEHIAHPRE